MVEIAWNCENKINMKKGNGHLRFQTSFYEVLIENFWIVIYIPAQYLD